jgi:glycerol dehydrogenase
VVYTPEGVQIAPEFFPNSPALVVLDTQIIINAPVRQLVSGMGDALATYYEARTCYENSAARSVIGGRITMTTLALARLCAETVMEHGLAAADAVRRKEIIDPFEKVVEANSLLSGVGFESGGLSTAHAVAAGLTVIPALHKGFFHGELVSMGILVHLLLEEKEDEALEVARFAAQVGLPVHAGQLDLDLEKDAGDIRRAMEGAVASRLPESEPFPVTPDDLVQAFTAANGLGLIVSGEIGDQAYRDLHP